MAPKIIPLLPPHQTYVEPFGGAASILLQKPISRQEVYNDLDGDIVNFFRVLRERPDELIRAIQLTPYAREEFDLVYTIEGDELERARRLYAKAWMAFGAATRRAKSGWRIHADLKGWGKSITEMWNKTDHLYAIAWRFKQVYIECQDALQVIRRWDTPTTLFYVDPPYEHSTRTGRNDYACEMTDQQHVELATLLHELEGMVVVSGNPSALYDRLYGDWTRRTFMERGLRNAPRQDCLWLSPNAISLNELPLFKKGESDHV